MWIRDHRAVARTQRISSGFWLFLSALTVVAQTPQRSASVHPDFDGSWSSATAIPLERPARLKDQPFYTPEQAAQLQKKARAADDDPLSRLETGSLMLPSLRTSIITDPPNGLLPSLTPCSGRRQEGSRGTPSQSGRCDRYGAPGSMPALPNLRAADDSLPLQQQLSNRPDRGCGRGGVGNDPRSENHPAGSQLASAI